MNDIDWQQLQSNLCYSIPISLFANLFLSTVTYYIELAGKIPYELYKKVLNNYLFGFIVIRIIHADILW